MTLKKKPDFWISRELVRLESTRSRNQADFRTHGVRPANKREECIALLASIDARVQLLQELQEVMRGN